MAKFGTKTKVFNEYTCLILHFELLKSRVQQLENELATTQKFAGIPVQLPYESLPGHGGNGNLSPPELLKQPPVSFILL